MASTGQITIEQLTDDLTVQQVILDSLKHEAFDGVEQERKVARSEIERIKTLLHKAKGVNTTKAKSVGATTTAKPTATSEAEWSKASNAYRRGEDDQAASGPSSGRKSRDSLELAGMESSWGTPRNDVWGELSSPTLPNRKRDVNAAYLDPRAGSGKSQRTTPTPSVPRKASSSNPFDGFSDDSFGDADFIDLTGDDDAIDQTYIEAQRKAEYMRAQQREQERQDREIARMLEDQYAESDLQPTSSNGGDAFSRIMGSQLPSGSDSSSMSTGMPREHEVNPVSLLTSSNLGMPGAFPEDPSMDHSRAPGRNQPSWWDEPMATDLVARRTPDAGSYYSANNLRFDFTSGQDSAFAPASSIPSNGMVSTTWDSYAQPQAYQPQVYQPLAQGNSLSDIISKTGKYNYADGTDGFGNPLPEYVTDLLQDAYHDPRMTDKDLDNLLQNIRPDMDIPEKNRDGTPAGLKRPLYPHQELALTWMKKMENGTNKGGILADDMGLGKTISTLALILSQMATQRPKTNLIIGPVALIRQWEEEIATKTKLSHRLSVFVYHNRKATAEDLLKYDVVLTTYGTIASELKRLNKFMESNKGRNIDFGGRDLSVKCPLLHPTKAKFYRVILDEAQCIKNKDTQTAKACYKLKTTYRWCLTGTPMMNGVLELYSLLHFLQIKPYSVWEQFRQAFGILFNRNGDSKSVAMRRLRALLKAIMLRRKKNSELDGKPILRLPEKIEEVVYAELSTDERDFYQQLEKNARVQFNKYLRDGSVGKNYSNILVLLLRMRQACCHPHLNLDVDDAAFGAINDKTQIELVKNLKREIVERIKGIEAFDCPICYDAVPSPSFFIPCGHDSCNECLVRLAENATARNLQEGTESSQAKCPVCRGSFEPSKCFTYELFKKVHMPERFKAESMDDEPEDEVSSSEEDSEEEFESDDEIDSKGNLRGFIIDDTKEDKKSILKTKKTKKAKGKKKAPEIRPSMLKGLRHEAKKNREAFKKYMRYLRKTWMPAAKVTECLKLLKKIQETGEKTIIFSQWTLLLDLIEVAMWHDKFPRKPERYDGSMSAIDRNIAAHNFRDKSDVKVMLVSLRAGNAGLNLTAASRVIIMDPFWNPYIEMQAVDRAYRIGQQREVKVYRILTKETVEDRIVALQDQKKEMVEAALDEAESAKIGRLGVSELKFLFNSGSAGS